MLEETNQVMPGATTLNNQPHWRVQAGEKRLAGIIVLAECKLWGYVYGWRGGTLRSLFHFLTQHKLGKGSADPWLGAHGYDVYH